MKRYFFLLLALLVVTTSCGSGSGVSDTPGQSTDAAAVVDTTPTPEVDHLETLATDRFAGRTLRIFDANDHPEMHINVAVDGQNGDIVNDALYDRDLLMEETFDITIEYTLSEGATYASTGCRRLERSVTAGDKEWEFVISCLLGNALSASASEGVLYNLCDIEALSLDQKWWSSQLYDSLRLQDIMYFTTGDISPAVYQGVNVVFANTRLLAEQGIEDDLLDIALDGKWTLDTLFALINDTNRDLNFDNKLSFQDDFFGLNYHSNIGTLLGGVGANSVTLNEKKDGFELNFNDERLVEIVEKISRYNFKAENTMDNDGPKYMFMEGRSIFYTHSVEVALSHFRDMEDDYIVLPMPKADELQQRYVSSYSGWISSFVAVPLTADTDFAGVMMEAMAYLGYRDIRPKAYDVVFKQKGTRDERSPLILDICFDNVYLDFNSVYDFAGSNWYLSGAACGETELISGLATIRSATEQAIAEFTENWTSDKTISDNSH